MSLTQITVCAHCGTSRRLDGLCMSECCAGARQDLQDRVIRGAVPGSGPYPPDPAVALRRFRHMVASALMSPEHYRDVAQGRPVCGCGIPLETGDPTEAFVKHVLGIKTCRICGCTDSDCGDCIARTGQPCSWVEGDLCSACT